MHEFGLEFHGGDVGHGRGHVCDYDVYVCFLFFVLGASVGRYGYCGVGVGKGM